MIASVRSVRTLDPVSQIRWILTSKRRPRCSNLRAPAASLRLPWIVGSETFWYTISSSTRSSAVSKSPSAHASRKVRTTSAGLTDERYDVYVLAESVDAVTPAVSPRQGLSHAAGHPADRLRSSSLAGGALFASALFACEALACEVRLACAAAGRSPAPRPPPQPIRSPSVQRPPRQQW